MTSAGAATTIFKPLSVAHSKTNLTLPSIFSTNSSKLHLPLLSRQPPSSKLTLSCFYSSPFFFSLKPHNRTHFTSFVSDEDNIITTTATLEQDQSSDTEANLSQWDPEGGEDSVIEPGGGETAEGGVYDSEEEAVELPEECKLFVGNLPYDVHSQDLAMLFEKAGIVEISEVIYNRETDQSRGFGFVTMSTVEEAEKAVELFHKYELNGRLLTVNKAAPRGARPERPPREFEPGFRIYVGNLPWDVDNGRLEQVFSEHGKVTSARVVYDRETGRSRGFGFVTMTNENEMNDSIAALDGQTLDGRAIRVNVAEERPRRNF